MSKTSALKAVAAAMEDIPRHKRRIERASVPSIGDSSEGDMLLLELFRANKLLDMRKDRLFMAHLNISSRATAERAILAYSEAYLLTLPMSLDSVQQLVKEMIDRVRSFKAVPPDHWLRISRGTFNFVVIDGDLDDEDDQDTDSNRLGADL